MKCCCIEALEVGRIMSDLAFLKVPVSRRDRYEIVADGACFQWCFRRGRAPDPESMCSSGDAVRWPSRDDDYGPAWTGFTTRNEASRTNYIAQAREDRAVVA